MHKTSAFLSKVALAVVALLLTTVLCEVTLRCTRYKQLLGGVGFGFRYYYSAESKAGYDITPNLPRHLQSNENGEYELWSNALGCWDEPYHGETGSILVLGDSFTFGLVPLHDNWGSKIQALLGERVLKCGVGGYGTRQEYLKGATLIPRLASPPKLIILGYYLGNDLQDDYCFPNSTVFKGYLVEKTVLLDPRTGAKRQRTDHEMADRFELYERYGIPEQPNNVFKRTKQWLVKHSILFQLSKDALKSTFLNLPRGISGRFVEWLDVFNTRSFKPEIAFFDTRQYPWLEAAWQMNFGSLRDMKQLAEAHGATLLVVVFPTKIQVYHAEGTDSRWEYPNRKLAEFFSKEGIQFLDLLPSFREVAAGQATIPNVRNRRLYFTLDFHLNNEGNQLAGLLIVKHILDHRVITISDDGYKSQQTTRELAQFR